ncbi:hypothetical protein [Moheibacter stercoris]|uniref:Uncharacterized protein n=1 Tax=Moheibacter stercoris TaxID=1628251 RepID=A0ABV2LPJ0_9FLAO
MASGGGSITRITGGDFLSEINGNWNVYTDSFIAQAGNVSAFTATEGTNHGNPSKDEDPYSSYFEEGWWSSDKEGNERIIQATIGQTVYFHIKTKNIKDPNAEVLLQLYDYDGIFNKDDKIDIYLNDANSPLVSQKVTNNKVVIPLILTEDLVRYIEDDAGSEIELYFDCAYQEDQVELPLSKSQYLKVSEKTSTLTVLIELPHSEIDGKLNQKGLGGHTGIFIDDEYYDFGPQPGKPFLSEGRPWWDTMNEKGNFTKDEMMNLLNNDFPTIVEQNKILDDFIVTNEINYPPTSRLAMNITGEVYLLDIHVHESEKERVKKWWNDRYNDLGKYSIIPILGEQCTTTVRISLSKNTNIFDLFPNSDLLDVNTITITTQTPKGFLKFLQKSGRHTSGEQKTKKIEVTKKYNEISDQDRNQFLEDLQELLESRNPN